MNKAQLQAKAERRKRREKYYTVLAVVFVVGILGMAALLVWQKNTQRLGSGDYEGRIVDRWADYGASTRGSLPYFRLVVEGPDGKRVTVKVDANTYEAARVGMRIKSRSGQVVLIDSDERKAGGT